MAPVCRKTPPISAHEDFKSNVARQQQKAGKGLWCKLENGHSDMGLKKAGNHRIARERRGEQGQFTKSKADQITAKKSDSRVCDNY